MLTVKEVARRWGVSPGMIYKLVAEGRLTCHRIGNAIRFAEEHLQQYLEMPSDNRRIKQTLTHLDL